MRIAVAANQANVADHFSKCEGFRVYEFNGNTIDVHNYFENSPELKGQLASVLGEMGVEKLVVGGIGEGQAGKLAAQGIELIAGIFGPVSEVVFALHRGDVQAFKTGEGIHKGCGSHGHGHGGGSCGCHSAKQETIGGCGCK